ncbi:MAG: sulfoxide reductase heme-binding subunit YedZ [Sphingomonas sp.]|nr:MAG: sulfoxide reductase heme-binding subunit YedZ [Sphingomonas sp.]
MAHLLAALPGLWLLAGWADLLWINPVSLRLSAEPVAYTHNALGLQALRLLIATLAVTPLFRLTRWSPIMSLRRLLGLWAFAYATVHLGFYLAMELDFSLWALWREALKKPFIFFGLAAFLCLLPLAATSTRAAIRALGGRRWQALHRLAYAAGIAACVHFILRVKGFQPEPYVYAALLALLLGLRLLPNRKRPSPAPARVA